MKDRIEQFLLDPPAWATIGFLAGLLLFSPVLGLIFLASVFPLWDVWRHRRTSLLHAPVEKPRLLAHLLDKPEGKVKYRDWP